jgi:hypothetical protein
LTTIVIGAWARAGSAKASIRTPAMTVRMGFPFLVLLRRLCTMGPPSSSDGLVQEKRMPNSAGLSLWM